MKIAAKKISVSLERRILIGLIVSTEFIKKVNSFYDRKYFTNTASKRIAKWCMDHYLNYGEAPKLHIKDIYEIQSQQGTLSEEDDEFIQRVLKDLSDEWEHSETKFNFDYLLDECEIFFRGREADLVLNDAQAALSNNDLSEAERLLREYNAPAARKTTFINPLTDEDEIRAAFAKRTEPLFKLPGALGKYLNHQLFREGFIAFQAPEKAGKSYFLQELIMRAIRNRCNVALFELGDMSKEDRICRIGSYVARKPFMRHKHMDDKVKARVPELKFDSEGEPLVDFHEEEYSMLSPADAILHGKKWTRRTGKDRLRISVHPSDTMNMRGIDDILTTWRDEDGWVPDVIGIDYMDIMAAEYTGRDVRTQTNDTWKAGRRLSQEWHALVLSVTQADAKSYGKSSQSLKNFSEDKRKYAHVTAMYSINQTVEERPKNTYRIGSLVVREGYTDPLKQIAIVHCLDLGRPYMYSYETSALNFDEGEEEDE